MNKTLKIIISILGFLILVAGLAAGVYLVSKNQDIREKAAPSTSILFNPETISAMAGQDFTSSSKISTGTNLVTGMDIELTYDPSSIQLKEIVPTSALNNFKSATSGEVIKNEIDNTAGKARFIAYVFDKTKALSGDLEILNVKGTVTSNSSASVYQVNYGSLTTMAAVDEGQNVVVNKSSLVINVTTPTPSPTASPTISPTASPTTSPTQSATPTPNTYLNWDVNQDGLVNMVDIGIVIDYYDSLHPTNTRADVNNDGIVNIVDIGIIIDHYQ